MLRLFVAIALASEAGSRLAFLQGGLPGARWVAPDNMHVTLRFIGDVDNGIARDIDDALVAVRAPGFEIEFAGVDTFGSGHTARQIWAGVRRSDALQHLRDKIESAVVRAGLKPEGRKFKPHVTLARLRGTPTERLGRFMEIHNVFRAGPYRVDRFTLFRSHLGHGGAHYEPLVDYPLAG